MRPDLNDILAFVTVAQQGSFTAAARELGLPKTTVSRKVQQLEARLGVQLLHRTTRRLGLTEAGTLYFQHCRPIAALLREADEAVAGARGAPHGWLRVTSSASIMINLVGPLLGEFRACCPGVRIDLILHHETLDLVGGGIDLALRMGPLPDSSMAARRLATFPNRIYASPDYLSRHGAPTHPDELPAHFALATRLARRGDGYTWPMSTGGELANYAINPVIVADDPEALKAPLLAGAGLMLATDMIMRRLSADGLVQPVMPGWTGRKPDLSAVFPRGRVQSPKLRAFIDFLAARLEPGVAS